MQPTEAQHQAITTRNNAIVVAGAGSGKTRVLVERYLTLLEHNPDWSLNALVAITFTRKAAGEMRDRVRTELERRFHAAGSRDDAPMRRRWSDLLGGIDSARINTIHGLCATILRTSAAEAGLDPDFVVLDETQASLLLSDAVDAAFAAVGATDKAGQKSPALPIFNLYPLYTVRELLSQPKVVAQPVPDAATDWLSAWRTRWMQDINSGCQTLLAQAATRTWQSIGTDAISKAWDELGTRLTGLAEAETPEDQYRLLQDIAAIRKPGAIPKAWGSDGEQAKADFAALRDTAKDLIDRCAPLDALDERAAQLIPAWIALLEQVQTHYRRLKLDNRALDFDDLEQLTARLLRDHPEVAARYQGREYRHLLVDEFQDTNDHQWTIAQHLAKLDQPGTLFVVGDPKQSIYAFRGANVSVFEQVRGVIVNAGGDSVAMMRSFRTHAPLVEQFNHLFRQILVTDDHSPVRPFQVDAGEPMEAFRQRPPVDAPPLELILVDAEKQSDPDLKTGDLRRWEAFAIATRLQELVTDGRLIYDKERADHRPVSYGDMALLFQAMTHVTVYEEVFRAVGIPFLTVAGRGYYDRQEVHDLLNLLRALYYPADNLSLAAALRSPLFNLSDDALYALRLTRLPLWEALDPTQADANALIPADERQRIAFAHRLLTDLHHLAGRVTISELLRLALAATGYLATLTGLPGGAQRRGNVEKLLTRAQSAGKVTLSDFSRYMDDLSSSEVREGDAALDAVDVVRLMTVHASKGLEFPVVVLPDAARERKNRESDLLTFSDGFCCKVHDDTGKLEQPFAYRRAVNLQKQRDDAEHRRLFYVAATRAQDVLIVSGQADTATWSAGGWLGWLLNIIPGENDHTRIHIPADYPDPELLTPVERGTTGLWETRLIREQQSFADHPILVPPLVNAVAPRRKLQARHLAATTIADVGGVFHSDDAAEALAARDRFRRKLLYDAPAVITRIQPPGSYRVSARQVGEIVHDALRWWQVPFTDLDPQTRRDLLRSYAWENHITDEEGVEKAVSRAERLLEKFSQSALYRWIAEATAAGMPIFRELPFIYERDTHIVHGVIDILFRRPLDAPTGGEAWVLADYKTSRLRRTGGIGQGIGGETADESGNLTRLTWHARRYHMQVGIYAEAARQQLHGILPQVYIHYLSYATSVEIPAVTWQAALVNGLGEPILQLLNG